MQESSAEMTVQSSGFQEYLAEEIKKYGGVMIPVKAGLMERLLVKEAEIKKLHPNPDDEFCMPGIGPNDRIISDYMACYQRYGSMKNPDAIEEDPLIVEKVHPDGYIILNGHHRWAAFWRLGVKKAPVSIVNLTQKTDIEKMIRTSKHDRRVTLDLDEVAFCRGDEPGGEPIKGFPEGQFKERLRPGIPALLQYLSRQGYDIWGYTAEYYSIEYIREYFYYYTVKIDGIVTGTGRKRKGFAEERESIEQLVRERYKQTLHIDRRTVLRTFSGSKDFEEYPVEEGAFGWVQTVKSIIRRYENNESYK